MLTASKALEWLSYLTGATGVVMAFTGRGVLEVLLAAALAPLFAAVSLAVWLATPAPWQLRGESDTEGTGC